MHDIVSLELAGVPSVMVSSQAFAQAARVQAAALGLEPACVLVAHPIQDRTDDEMRALADAAFAEIALRLTATAP